MYKILEVIYLLIIVEQFIGFKRMEVHDGNTEETADQ